MTQTPHAKMVVATGLTSPKKALLIDNFDSFTFNLFQLLASVDGTEPYVLYNTVSWDDLRTYLPLVEYIVISPGPGVQTRNSEHHSTSRRSSSPGTGFRSLQAAASGRNTGCANSWVRRSVS